MFKLKYLILALVMSVVVLTPVATVAQDIPDPSGYRILQMLCAPRLYAMKQIEEQGGYQLMVESRGSIVIPNSIRMPVVSSGKIEIFLHPETNNYKITITFGNPANGPDSLQTCLLASGENLAPSGVEPKRRMPQTRI
jgi:hypothetical protein